MIWDGVSNVQCVEHKETLIHVKDVVYGFVKIICLDINNVRRESNATVY